MWPGRKEPAKIPSTGARRELLEETGYTAKRLRKILASISHARICERVDVDLCGRGIDEGQSRNRRKTKRSLPRIFTEASVDAMIQQRNDCVTRNPFAGLLYYMRYVKTLAKRIVSNHFARLVFQILRNVLRRNIFKEIRRSSLESRARVA